MRALAALLTLAVALAGCGDGGAHASDPPAGSTLRSTFADPDGDGFLQRAPGEPMADRPALGSAGTPGRVLATLGQLTDTHVRDEESPARVPFLDRFGDPFGSTFRPQEALSAQVLDAAVRALDRERPQAVVVTGDIVDSAQANELALAIGVLRGGRVRPDSGAPGYDGVQQADDPDPLFYRPDVDAPRHPGLLDAAQRPFRATGLRAPFYPAVGNHDLLAEGEVPPTPALDAVATGGRMVTGVDPEHLPPQAADALRDARAGRTDPAASAAAVRALLGPASGDAALRTRTVPADPGRRLLQPAETVHRLARAARVLTRGDRLDYAADVGPAVRLVVLDTVRRTGGSRGVVSPGQVTWLREQLARAGRRWVLVAAHNPLEASDGGGAALAALDADPRVVAVLAGNRHRNTIEPRRSAHGHGYWLIGTCSLADFPQQARMLRLRSAPHGVVLETWMADQDGRGLAGAARELAYLDAQGGRPKGFAGRRTDRNARLPVPAP